MAVVDDVTSELEGIQRATRRADLRRRVEIGLSAASAIVSGACLAFGLYAIYSALAGAGSIAGT